MSIIKIIQSYTITIYCVVVGRRESILFPRCNFTVTSLNRHRRTEALLTFPMNVATMWWCQQAARICMFPTSSVVNINLFPLLNRTAKIRSKKYPLLRLHSLFFTPRQNEGYCNHNICKTLPRGCVAPSGFWFGLNDVTNW